MHTVVNVVIIQMVRYCIFVTKHHKSFEKSKSSYHRQP
jgi:hypothetical protein